MRHTCHLALVIGTGLVTALPSSAIAEGPIQAVTANLVTLGLPKNKVDALLGPVRSTWTIHSLQREMVTYTDGSKAIFVNNLLISANPAGMALDALTHGYLMERQNRQIQFDPSVLGGGALVGPIAETKRQVEESFWMGPRNHAPPPPYTSFVPAFEPDAPLFPLFPHVLCRTITHGRP